jgi:hypothetical protein
MTYETTCWLILGLFKDTFQLHRLHSVSWWEDMWGNWSDWGKLRNVSARIADLWVRILVRDFSKPFAGDVRYLRVIDQLPTDRRPCEETREPPYFRTAISFDCKSVVSHFGRKRQAHWNTFMPASRTILHACTKYFDARGAFVSCVHLDASSGFLEIKERLAGRCVLARDCPQRIGVIWKLLKVYGSLLHLASHKGRVTVFTRTVPGTAYMSSRLFDTFRGNGSLHRIMKKKVCYLFLTPDVCVSQLKEKLVLPKTKKIENGIKL